MLRHKLLPIMASLLLVAGAACTMPAPNPIRVAPSPQAPTPGGGGELGPTQPDVGATQQEIFTPLPEPGGAGTPPTQAAQEPVTQPTEEVAEPAAQGTQHEVFAPSVQSGGGSGSFGADQPDPHVEIQASLLTIDVGQTITVTGRPVDIGMPVYTLILRDEGVQEAPPVVEVTSGNVSTPGAGSSKNLELVSFQAGPGGVFFVFRGLAPGITTLTILATGEITTGTTTTTGAGSGEIILTVNP